MHQWRNNHKSYIAEEARNGFQRSWRYLAETCRQIPTITPSHWAYQTLETLHVEPDGYLADTWLDIKCDLATQSQSGYIEAWTDGSFKRSVLDAPMSWAAFFPAINRHISGRVEGQAFSTLPEATAILAVLEIAPQNSSVLIHTDSQACHTKMSGISTKHTIHWPWHNLWNI